MLPKPPVPVSPIVALSPYGASIDAVLPQTQCQRCGYPSCAAYAQAIAEDETPINQCPPGGDAGIHALVRVTGQGYAPLNPEHGTEAPLTVAWIDEARCIGCTLCLQACPVDAIVGANKRMHTVIEVECSGCDLCAPVCPVDCIVMIPPRTPIHIDDAQRNRWRARQQAHLSRYWGATATETAEARVDDKAALLARIMEKAKARV
jgi:Na+-translocating ferredoxin:NAD+ oxidoreductase subunit B